jgi:hypothetical protein
MGTAAKFPDSHRNARTAAARPGATMKYSSSASSRRAASVGDGDDRPFGWE